MCDCARPVELPPVPLQRRVRPSVVKPASSGELLLPIDAQTVVRELGLNCGKLHCWQPLSCEWPVADREFREEYSSL